MIGIKLVFARIACGVVLYIGMTPEKVDSQVNSICDGIEIRAISIDTKQVSPSERFEADIRKISSKMYGNSKKREVIITVAGPAFNDYRDSNDTKNIFSCTKKGLSLTTYITRYTRATSGRYANWRPLLKLELISSKPKLEIEATWRLISGENLNIELHDLSEDSDNESKKFPIKIHETISLGSK
jgi:hypothetical protein